MKYLFLGKTDLFEGLWIEGKYHFNPHPVLHISFSSIGYKTMGLSQALEAKMDRLASDHDIVLTSTTYDQKFSELMERLGGSGPKVVLLIDEYDKPIRDFLKKPEKAKENREILEHFFSVINHADAFIHFTFITSVYSFSQRLLYSEWNSLEDITMSPRSATLTGFTQTELEEYFEEHILKLSFTHELGFSEILGKIRLWYLGYQWAGPEKLYNPFSILKLMKQQQFLNTFIEWETGRPADITPQLREGFYYNLDELETAQLRFTNLIPADSNWVPFLFQNGYLTICGYNPTESLFTFAYPNREVKEFMYLHLIAAFRETKNLDSWPLLVLIKRSLEEGNLIDLIYPLNSLFSTIPHQLFHQKQEGFFHAILHLAFSGVGLLVQSEVSTSKGRVDTVVHTKDRIYVIEFKLDGSAASALDQIREKRYGSPYLGQGKEVLALGVNFSSSTMEVAEWDAVPYESLLVEG